MILWLRANDELSWFTGWLTPTQRWHAERHSSGGGHVGQGSPRLFIDFTGVAVSVTVTDQSCDAQTAADFLFHLFLSVTRVL